MDRPLTRHYGRDRELGRLALHWVPKNQPPGRISCCGVGCQLPEDLEMLSFKNHGARGAAGYKMRSRWVRRRLPCIFPERDFQFQAKILHLGEPLGSLPRIMT